MTQFKHHFRLVAGLIAMKHHHQLPILFTLSLSLFSCHTPRYTYAPIAPNNPFFQEKGESKLSAFYSGRIFNNREKRRNYGYDLQGAYAVTDHFALTAAYSTRKERDHYKFYGYEPGYQLYDTSLVRYKRKLLEIGGGYFGLFDRSNDEITLNLYGGVGFGKFSFDDRGLDRSLAYHRFYKANVVKFYIQPGINFMPVGRFKVSFVSRLSLFLHNNISTSYTKDELDYFYLTGIDNSALFVWEPSSAVQFSIPKAEWIKAEAGATFGIKLPSVATGRGRFSNFSIGLTFDPARLFRK